MPTDPTFLMPVEDVFSIRGRGTVVTGTVDKGVLKVGDTIIIRGQLEDKTAEVSKIETFRKPVDQVGEGDHVGVFLKDIAKEDVQRGDVLLGSSVEYGWEE